MKNQSLLQQLIILSLVLLPPIILSQENPKQSPKKLKFVAGAQQLSLAQWQEDVDKLLNKMISLIEENKGSGSGVLKARKAYDAWVKSQKPKVFSAETENAFSIANREIRQTLNTILDEKAVSVSVKEELKSQSNLFNAPDITNL